jgi:hypothetical protein
MNAITVKPVDGNTLGTYCNAHEAAGEMRTLHEAHFELTVRNDPSMRTTARFCRKHLALLGAEIIVALDASADRRLLTPLEYHGHQIVPKKDFGDGPGHLINGRYVKSGWVVVKDGGNVMPGAAWFENVDDAQFAIDLLIISGSHTDLFWAAMTRYCELDTAGRMESARPYQIAVEGLNAYSGSPSR